MFVFISTTAPYDTYSLTSVPRGYSVPKRKVKRIMDTQRSTTIGGTLGVAGGKPTASVHATTGRSTSSTTEVADDEVCLVVSYSRYS